jgi:hypothetical protein
MRKSKLYIQGALVGALTLVMATFGLNPVLAQVPSANPPFNVENTVLTNTARVAGTVNSAQLGNLDKTGAICSFNTTATATGAIYPQVVLAIQNYDAASGNYYTIATTSASSPGVNNPIVVIAHDGVLTTSLPAGVAAAAAMPLSRFWRVQQVTSGLGTHTGTVDCVTIK